MKRKVALLTIALTLALTLTACGGSSTSNSFDKMEAPATPGAAADMGFDSNESWAGQTAEEGRPANGQKLIRTAWLEMETTSFDQSVSGLTTLTEDFHGYFESRVITNYSSGHRYANFTIRVPASQYSEFLAQAGSLCHLTRQEDTQEDISESYYDTAGRLETQKIKLERLQKLLKEADRMEDIITIESAISETEQTIDALSGTLRHYDGKVEYATVYITLGEVYRLSNVEDVPESFLERLSSSFRKGLEDFADEAEDFVVYLAYAWLHWLIAIALLVIVVQVIRRIMTKRGPSERFSIKRRRRKQKHDDTAEKVAPSENKIPENTRESDKQD